MKNDSLNPTDVMVAEKTGCTVGEIILTRLIDTLNNAERIELRTALIAAGIKNLPRNLYFNYETQEWL